MNDKIADLLKRFCVAMYVLDIACFSLRQPMHAWSGKDADAYKFDSLIEMQREWVRGVFKRFCIDYENPKRDYGVGADPPDYHPDYFDILEIKVKGKKATAKVRQPQLGRMKPSMGGGIVIAKGVGGDILVYHLKLTDVGWRLEDRREFHWEDGRIIRTGL